MGKGMPTRHGGTATANRSRGRIPNETLASSYMDRQLSIIGISKVFMLIRIDPKEIYK